MVNQGRWCAARKQLWHGNTCFPETHLARTGSVTPSPLLFAWTYPGSEEEALSLGTGQGTVAQA